MSPEPSDQHFPLLTSAGRLQKIDQLRERNIGAYLPLPQLVAVGDQSSGKSSLLESLTGIPFPRGQELCTRFATQITHRREAQQRIDITIIPGPHASKGHKKKLVSYRRQVQTTTQLCTEFPDILAQANALMSIKTVSNTTGENTFSEDILKIEKCGPNEDYLTIIDVPGIFRTTTEGVTTNKDKGLVKDMVKRYIKDSRTIILAVLPSNVDVATQGILTLAEEADPAGDRTLGILTKADLLTERTARLAVVKLLEGSRKPLKLGYHVITNRGGDDHGEEDNALAALHEREAIFLKHPWSNLPVDRLGISSLRERLEELLGEITDRAFPELRSETRQKLAKAEKKLKDLGVPRQTEREQQQYLVGIASNFQALVRAALDADYSAHPAFGKNALRLVTAVVNTTEQFNTDFDKLARTILSSVFREQSAKWERIAKQYLSKIILLVHRFILAALEVVCADTQVLQSVSSAILNDLCAKYEGSMDQAILLVNVERQLKPYTLNHYFNHNQQRSYGFRIMETLRPKARRENSENRGKLVINLRDVPDAVTNKSNAAHATETIHDTLEAYYEVAYKRFVDNVFSQAVDYKLLSGPESPLRLFSEQWVLCLDPKELLFVAGESRRTRESRERLKNEIQDLEVAMEILR
ncbi:interferon-induced GTP-binding protein Mx2 [Colletotrichum tofieldiae]|nr:interferon-induced GTP-binding protein Mx2 [Colletotrichum tofieldiae]